MTCIGLMGFAQKLSIKRGGMMCDAAHQTILLIRYFDNEDVETPLLCRKVADYLNHISWMFFKGGVFEISGHAAFIKTWCEAKTHHFAVGPVGKSFGGIPFTQAVKNKVFEHMQAWVLM
eukprot:9854335-Karenia_brevis.AAC.1